MKFKINCFENVAIQNVIINYVLRILIKPEGKKNGKGPTPKSKKTT